MKKVWLFFGMLALSVSVLAAAEAKTDDDGNFYRMGRGLVNLVTCPAEVPRCMVYRNSEIPFWGLIAGAVDGVGCCAMRAVTGVTDVLFLGFDYGTAFNAQFRPFVWQSSWLPPKPAAEAGTK